MTWTGARQRRLGRQAASAPSTDTVTTDGTTTRTTTVTDNVGNSATSDPVTVKPRQDRPDHHRLPHPRRPTPPAGTTPTSPCRSAPRDATSGVKSATAPDDAHRQRRQPVRDRHRDRQRRQHREHHGGGINIDKVAPTLSGKPTSDPNAAGWFNDDVTIAWTATDTLSGVTAPANSTIGGEGTGLTATAGVTDKAGQQQRLRAERAGQDRPDRAAHDGLGPAGLEQQRPHPEPHRQRRALGRRQDPLRPRRRCETVTGTSVPVTSEGQHTLEFWSTDVAGNVEAQRSPSPSASTRPRRRSGTPRPGRERRGVEQLRRHRHLQLLRRGVRRRQLHRPAARHRRGQGPGRHRHGPRQRGQHRHRPGHGQHRPDPARPSPSTPCRRRTSAAGTPTAVTATFTAVRRPVRHQDRRTTPTPSVRAPTRPPPRRPPTPPATAPRSPPRRSTSTLTAPTITGTVLGDPTPAAGTPATSPSTGPATTTSPAWSPAPTTRSSPARAAPCPPRPA